MKTVKTARGRELNMSAIAIQNETARAVGNVPVNARGDIIDNRGNVKVSREQVTKQAYKEAAPDATAKEVGIKEDDAQVAEQQSKKAKKPKEVNRELREREDGSQYIEVEYSDGSMDTVEINEDE